MMRMIVFLLLPGGGGYVLVEDCLQLQYDSVCGPVQNKNDQAPNPSPSGRGLHPSRVHPMAKATVRLLGPACLLLATQWGHATQHRIWFCTRLHQDRSPSSWIYYMNLSLLVQQLFLHWRYCRLHQKWQYCSSRVRVQDIQLQPTAFGLLGSPEFLAVCNGGLRGLDARTRCQRSLDQQCPAHSYLQDIVPKKWLVPCFLQPSSNHVFVLKTAVCLFWLIVVRCHNHLGIV